MKSNIQYWKSKRNKQYYFHIKANNNKVVGQSEGYKSAAGVLKGVNAISKALHLEGFENIFYMDDMDFLGVK